ncbi:hypothetical protein ACQKP0_21765 [Heyndrickxia sp. NPDC080065]|uniref:hypothetical protein n=1 Tax=Heyndrickxia sp. NPDC080065 TaxID=3390568 RepID=UPI003CFF6FC5
MKTKMLDMGKQFNRGIASAYAKVKSRISNEQGVSTVEWVGLAFVVLMLMFAVQAAMSGQGGSLAGAIVNKISEIISKVGSGG